MKNSFLILLLASLATLIICIHGEEESRLLGASVANRHYPYQISLQRRVQNGWSHFCGGSIITRRHIVTAAHCLTGKQSRDISVWAGSNKLNGNDGLRYLAASYIWHPQYVPQTRADVGVVAVQGMFAFSSTISAISYSTRFINGGVTCLATGWGVIIPDRMSAPPNDLRQLSLTTITTQQCVNAGFRRVTDTEICTQPPRGSGACAGDSGGPLALGNLLVGIVSYGPANCGNGNPDVFTRVSAYYGWINTNSQ